MTYAFSFDARFCSGCKACQAACKDKNNLPPGVLWRRVIEVSGGAWQPEGAAWNNTVFAYNISVACNHCVHPKCAGVCPANAYTVRADGIVLLDETKCTGCGYCSWACHYGVPQYNPVAGHMSKCNFCIDQIEQGLPPTCVAACPLRVLDYRDEASGSVTAENEIRLWDVPPGTHPYPLPSYSHTQPRLAIQPHPAMRVTEEKFVANLEEVQPRSASQWEELPLLLFTLLAQMATGSFWAMLWMFPSLWTTASSTTFLRLLPPLVVGGCLGAGALASLAHLGTKRKALNMLRNLRRSWLSREVLFVGLFGLGWLITPLEIALSGRAGPELMGISAALGLALVYSMAQVYRLPTVSGWNTWRTNAGFMASSLLLGIALMSMLLSYEPRLTGSRASSLQWTITGIGIAIFLLVQLALMQRSSASSDVYQIRRALIGFAIILSISLISLPATRGWVSLLVLLIALVEETMGRWSFYRARSD
jgi:anaerobic dimethyl sulfoxide reductase subunit B (iron-sulfur subunit)